MNVIGLPEGWKMAREKGEDVSQLLDRKIREKRYIEE